jgi:diguanylate cyclase (GGDEF)-like protein
MPGMTASLFQAAAAHSSGFVATALTICVVAGWLLAELLRRSETKPARRLRWQGGTALVAGLGVWTTHFIAMLGYRPDMALGYDGPTTAASALIAVLAVGVPFAASARPTGWRRRTGLGALAGLGIGAMHYTGMLALEGCTQTYSIAAAVLGCLVGACGLGAGRGVPDFARSATATCLLFTLAVCGTHFIAIAGTSLTAEAGGTATAGDDVVLSVFAAAGAAVLFLGAFASILTARRFEAQEQAHSIVLSTALDNMSNGLVYFDRAGRAQLFNQRFGEIFGIEIARLRVGLTPDGVIEAIGDVKGWNAERRALARSRVGDWMRAADFTTFDYPMDDGRIMEVEIRPVPSGGSVLTFDDVTKDRQAQRRIEELVFVDPLTKLANRRALQERMEQDFRLERWYKLLLIDLDRFKTVNDTYGHGTGDKLLVQVADRIRTIVGPTGFAARLGGDELAVLVHGDLDLSMTVANEIVATVGRSFLIDGVSVSIGCSIGLCCTDDARDAAELMQRSDVALYEAKRSGRGRATCYRPGMLEVVVERQKLETDLRMAIERDEFHLAYQPVLSLADDRVIGYEALIRWTHPTLGAVSPAQFIPMAEETGQIVEIGRWVLEEACREAATWTDDRFVAVNVSAVQFRSPLLMAHLTGALARSGLPARRLEIELTETAMVDDGRQIAGVLDAIEALGVRIAMDDFGTGYSSLAHLRDFPLDRIKIDRSFVVTAQTDPHSLAVLRGIAQIGREMGVAILAEGVETEAQLELIRSIGCDDIQGYLVGRPAPMAPGRGDGLLLAR